MTFTIKTMREPLKDINSKHRREIWRIYGHGTYNYFPNYGTSKKQHFDRRQRIADLRYKSKKCWVTLSNIYLDNAENNISGSHSEIKQNNVWRT
jgi:hypothetical protein